MIEHQLHNSYDIYNAFLYTDIEYKDHFHKNYELIYIVEGEMTLYIDNQAVNLQKSEMILLSPFTIHSFLIDNTSRVWIGVFSENYILSFAKKNNRLQYSKFICNKTIEEFLKKYLFYQGTPDMYIGKSCLYMVCSECLKNASIEASNPEFDFKQQVIDFIYTYIFEDITLKKIAQALGYEYHYFSSLFHESFHMNFREFVNIFRYEYAREMLLDKTKDISYIAGECGFQSIRSFNRIFKKLNGKTPSEYRKSI